MLKSWDLAASLVMSKLLAVASILFLPWVQYEASPGIWPASQTLQRKEWEGMLIYTIIIFVLYWGHSPREERGVKDGLG